MVEIAREQARAEGVDAHFDTADFEQLDLERAFDACLTYDALHHSERPELVLASAHRALKPGGLLLVSEPNWKQRYQGRDAANEYGTTELGYSPRTAEAAARATPASPRSAASTTTASASSATARLDVLAHLAEPITYRVLAPFWTQVWLRARAR